MIKIRKHFLSLLALVLALAGAVPALAAQNSGKASGQFIVVLKDSVSDVDYAAYEIEKKHGLGHLDSYKHALKGFAATVPLEELEKIKQDPRVEFVSEDREVSILDKGPGGNNPPPALQPQAQSVPTGVARVGAPANPNKGAGVAVAVIDTGIDLTHPDLTGNILGPGKNCVRPTKSPNDDNGHGSHVAGTIAAINNGIGVVGVAPQAKLVPVKVLDAKGRGTWSQVICGIDWVTANASVLGIKVANMSLGGLGTSDDNCGNTNFDALHKAICRSRDAGVTYVVAAGNEADSAGSHVPAAYNDAVITVSALADSNGISGGGGPATAFGPDDTFASFSNFGASSSTANSIVDLGAPGVNIRSTWKGGAYNTISGTSMSSPHAAGAAALYIKSHPGSLWSQVRDGLAAAGEALGAGHTDPSGLHPEPVLNAGSL